jgi:hypothetical protein
MTCRYTEAALFLISAATALNLATWFSNNQKPLSVTAGTRQTKSDIYTKVDDNATVAITYPKTQVIVMAS